MERVYLSLGTNIGDREKNISDCLQLLDEALGTHYDALSGIEETEPWGFEGGNFLNCVVRYVLDMEPLQLLSVCKETERRMGRTGEPEYGPDGKRIYRDRIIDIDILLFGDRKIDTPSLTVPHPLMEKRDFVMRPLREILHDK